MRLLILFIISITYLASSPADAQTPYEIQLYKVYNEVHQPPSTAIIISEVMKSALDVQKNKGGCLPSSAVIDMVTPASVARFVGEGLKAQQIRNAWTVVVRHPNCGSDIVRYALVRQYNDGLYGFRINRGRSNANESVIGDTLPQTVLLAYVILKRAGSNCDVNDATLGITRITEESSDLSPDFYGVRFKGSWREVWPIILCNRTVEISINFRADGSGGVYTDTDERETKLLPETR